MHQRIVCPLLIALLALTAPAAATPQVGDKAPEIKIAKWMASPAPALPGSKDGEKHVYLVEFWATWCGPCIKSIPHLTELHRKHEKDGLVVIGISNEEPEVVADFIAKKLPARKLEMPYYVGCDDESTTTAKWMDEIDTIPHAFLVDRAGLVVWSGNPLGDTTEMDEAIRLTLAGKYDVTTAKQAAAARKKYEELMGELQTAYQAQDKDKIFKTLGTMMDIRPKDAQPYLIHREMLRQFEMDEQIPAWDKKLEAAMQDSSGGLMDLVDVEMRKPLAERNAGLLYRSAKRAVELSGGRDADALAVLAEVQCQLGMLDAAIASQKQAVELAAGPLKDEYRKVLTYFEEARRLTAK